MLVVLELLIPVGMGSQAEGLVLVILLIPVGMGSWADVLVVLKLLIPVGMGSWADVLVVVIVDSCRYGIMGRGFDSSSIVDSCWYGIMGCVFGSSRIVDLLGSGCFISLRHIPTAGIHALRTVHCSSDL